MGRRAPLWDKTCDRGTFHPKWHSYEAEPKIGPGNPVQSSFQAVAIRNVPENGMPAPLGFPMSVKKTPSLCVVKCNSN